jgi:hypothetical protein
MWTRVTATVAALLGGGCLVEIDYAGTGFRCDSSGECPEGQVCEAGTCTATPAGSTPDAGPALDGGPTPDAPIDPAGPVLRWDFDEGSGQIAVDASPTGVDGVIDGAVYVASERGTALSFDGELDAVTAAAAPRVLAPAVGLAVAARVKPIAAPGEVVSLGDNWGLRVIETGARFFVYDGLTWELVESEVPLTDGLWHHVVGQHTGAALEIYVDGALAAELPYAVPIDYSLGPDLLVGRHGNQGTTFDYAGEIDEVRVFDRALSAAEIAELAP